MRNRIIMKVNYLYSVLWIAITGADKYAYRERSIVRAALMGLLH